MRKLIGKGSFTKAYQISETEVEIISTCPTKECYALFSQSNPLAPRIERGDKENSFLMPLYPKMKSPKKQLNPEAYRLYMALKNNAREFYSCKNYYEFTKNINDASDLTEEQKENICSLASDVCNSIDTWDMRFEISPRNVSCDSEGNLVLLDCFFCHKLLQNTWKKKQAAPVYYPY